MRRTLICGMAALLAVASSAQAAIVYDASIQTGFRTNVGQAGFFTGATADSARVNFDDVLIPAATLGLNTLLEVTKVTVGIRQVAGAPATDVLVSWTTFTTTPIAPDSHIDSPGSLIGTQSLGAAAAAVTSIVTIGDGITPLFTAPLNLSLIPGFGSFALGVQLSSTSNLNGWRNTTPAVGFANANQAAWMYDPNHTATANTEVLYSFGVPSASVPPSTYYIVIEGTPVPEPTTLSMLAIGGLMLLKRRRA
ncbi:MAG: PEP-CTERM sorting domain-containing protein [Planctomycetes bacterium]|nr:PEP-CTERM sorting domain-containing protein [Planctomycetota bacterium]